MLTVSHVNLSSVPRLTLCLSTMLLLRRTQLHRALNSCVISLHLLVTQLSPKMQADEHLAAVELQEVIEGTDVDVRPPVRRPSLTIIIVVR